MLVSRKRLLSLLLLLCAASVTAAPSAGPIVYSSIVDPNFGVLQGGPAGRDFILTTAGMIGGANASDYLYGASPGMVNIVADNKSSIDILATNLTANGGVTIVNVTCKYGNGPDMDCDQGFTAQGKKGIGQDMYIGLEIQTTQVHGEGDTAAPTFDIVINYL